MTDSPEEAKELKAFAGADVLLSCNNGDCVADPAASTIKLKVNAVKPAPAAEKPSVFSSFE